MTVSTDPPGVAPGAAPLPDPLPALGRTLDEAGALKGVLADLESRSRAFGSAITSALAAAALSGKGLDSVLKSLMLRISSLALSAAMKPLDTLIGQGISGLVGSAVSGFSGTAGSSTTGLGAALSRVTPFADGGVIAAPTLFRTGNGSGLMGEAGAEAILPLRRGPDGAMGVALQGSGGRENRPSIVFNITTPDAESFRRSQGQIAALVARTVERGHRNL